MRINKINFNTQINFLGTDKEPSYLSCFNILKHDTFERRIEENKEVNLKIERISKRQKVPFGANLDFMQCPKTRLDEIFKQIPVYVKEAAEESVFAGQMTKEMYDEKYGKDNYVFVSIGTSPAGIAKVMEYMGADVRYVPVTSLNMMSNEELNNFIEKKKELKEYKDFLNSIGLNKNNIEKSEKHYIFADFTVSGKSLNIASDISKRYFGINSKNVSFESINDKLMDMANAKYTQRDCKRVKRYIVRYMEYSGIEDYCGIPHIHYTNLNSIKRRQEQDKSEEARMFELALCYYLKNGKKI